MKQMNDYNCQDMLGKIYDYVKSVTADYYMTKNVMHIAYESFLDHILIAEEGLGTKKIVDVLIDYEKKDDMNFIDEVVYDTRRFLLEKRKYRRYRVNIQEADMTDKCIIASKFVNDFCEDSGVKSYTLVINPGYAPFEQLYEGNGYHFANIIEYKDEYYLIDTTYSQFFHISRNVLNRIGIVNLSGCNAGVFALMTEERKELAVELLQKGYVKLEKDALKTYLDPFTISFRNGLFYEERNDFSYTTDYSVDDYIRFLKGFDNQVNHEGKTNLGYQKKPLKNAQLDFRKR